MRLVRALALHIQQIQDLSQTDHLLKTQLFGQTHVKPKGAHNEDSSAVSLLQCASSVGVS